MYARSAALIICLAAGVALGQQARRDGAGIPASGPSTAPTAETVEMTLVDRTCPDLGFGNCQWLYPLDAPKKKLLAEPAYKSQKPVYYAAKFGDAPDNIYTLVIDESGGTGAGYDTLYLDADNDGRLDGKKERLAFSMTDGPDKNGIRVKFHVRSGGKTFPYSFSFKAFPYQDKKNPHRKVHATLRDSGYLVGQLTVRGQSHKVALADLNSNGLFNDAQLEGIFTGDRFFIDLNDNGSFKDETGDDGGGGFPYGGLTRIDGQWYAVTASPDGSELTISPASPTLGTVKAAPVIAAAFLTSPRQACRLTFLKGQAQCLTGSYTLRQLTLKASDRAGKTWSASVFFPKDARKQVTVGEQEPAVLKTVGLPLQIRPTVEPAGGTESLQIGLEAVGSNGEQVSWPSSGDRNPPKPSIEVRDSSGKTVYSTSLEFG